MSRILKERIEKWFEKLENGNEIFHKRFEKFESDNAWIKDVLESYSTVLARLDQEKIFLLNYIN